MISDVLFEALEEIERYQREMPDCYGDIMDEIESVKAAMEALRMRLDTPPPPLHAEMQEYRGLTDEHTCPDCGAAVGEPHEPGCDVERCPYCGDQLISCEHDAPLDDRILWDGCWPGERECTENGWFVRFDKEQGKYIPCDPGDPDAQPDINRFRMEYRWDRKEKRWLRK